MSESNNNRRNLSRIDRLREKRRRRKRRKQIRLLVLSLITLLGIGVFKLDNLKLYASENEDVKSEVNKNLLVGKADENSTSNHTEQEENISKEDDKEEKIDDTKSEEDNKDNLENSTDTEVASRDIVSNDTYEESAKDIENRINSWNYLREDGKKIAYLTFDDGPSEMVTPQVLDVLRRNNIKATFFVLGRMVEDNYETQKILKDMVRDGHAIGNHGYCHRYDVLYPNGVANTEVFLNDMQKSENVLKSVLGDDFSTRVIRFPGGHVSWDTEDLDVALEASGYAYIDWNTLNGDAEGQNISPAELIGRLEESIIQLNGNDDVVVVLMHDTDAKETTAQSLQQTIDYLKEQGYEFKTLK